MARDWHATRAVVWEMENVMGGTGVPFSHGGRTYITEVVDGSVTWTRYISQIGNGAATFYAFANWEQFLVPGRIVVVDKGADWLSLPGRLLACFLIDEIEPAVNNGMSVIHVRGQGVEALLNKQTVWQPIGALTAHYTELDVSIAAPTTHDLLVGAPAGNETLLIDGTGSDNVKQEIRVTMNGGAVHVSVVTERKFYNDQWYLVMRDSLPYDADAGANKVQIRQRRFRVKDTAGFIPGAEVVIAHGGNTHYTTLAHEAIEDVNRVTMEDGIPWAVPADTEVIVSDRFSPATDDVTQIVAHAPEWEAEFQTGSGTAVGTAHVPHGETVFELLNSVADRTGEYWRYRIDALTNAPTYKIQWRRSADSSGVTLIQYDSDEYARQVTDEMSQTKGAIISLRRKRALPLVTKLYPAAGDQRVSLADCSTTARNYATSHGCAVNSGSGLYEPDFVTHTAGVSNYGLHELHQTYGDISLGDAASQTALIAACDQLLISAVQTLVTAQMREYYTVEAFVPANLSPGQTVKIENATRVEPSISASADWYILEVTERLVEGRPRTSLVVSNMLGLRWTPATQFAQKIKGIIQSQRRVGTGGATTMSVGGGTGGGTGGVTDHGMLTGLGDDDHPQYLLASGARPLASNLTVNPGVTIDGVDISAHAANADAHHARVTAANASLVVNATQGVRVADSFAGAGLSLAGGVLAANVSVTQGTQIANDAIGVLPLPDGGLQNTGGGLSLKVPASSGLILSSAGVALGTPGALSAASLNAVSGSQHTHLVTAVDNAKTGPGQLLRGSAAGDLTLRYLTADQVTTPIVNTATGGLRLDPANGVTTNDGNLSFVGARSILTDTGSLTLAPAQTLIIAPTDGVAQVAATTTLKTAHAAVGVFPQTGWQVGYDGDAYFTSLLADELHVQSFIADLFRVKVGGEYITESMALIRRDMTIPAVGGTAALYVEDVPGWPNVAAFAEGDWVLLRVVNRENGGLIVASAWGQVTGYVDRADGEQSWTYTTRVATSAVGRRVAAGDVALDYGKVGSSWWYVTAMDAGGPHAGFATWYGANPADNPEYWLRMGQLKGVSGVYERGFQTGKSNSSFTRLSELRNEIHGSRLSLYAGDGGRLQVSAVEVLFYRTGTQSSTLAPDADGTAVNVETTTANYFSAVNEGTAAPNHATYIANKPNLSAAVFLSLSNPAAFSSIFRIDIRAALRSTGLTNDTVRLYGQVFASDMATPLTGEVLLSTRTTNTTATTTVTAPHTGYGTGGAVATDWNGARLRLRWEYEINAVEEAIRLDPSVPSLAIGNPLPTGTQTGGAGLWAGWIGPGTDDYALRIGGALGAAPQLLYNGANGVLSLRSSSGEDKILFDADGNGQIAGALTIGAAGGIWQGTGTFTSPTTGLKIYNSGGVGRLSTYNGGLEQVTINTAGQLTAGQGKIVLDRDGLAVTVANSPTLNSSIRFREAGQAAYGSIEGMSLGDEWFLSLRTNYAGRMARMVFDQSAARESIYLETTDGHSRVEVDSDNGVSLTGKTQISGDTRISGGLTLADAVLTPPAAGRILMKQSTGTATVPPGCALLSLENQANGRQRLWVRFDDNSYVFLAESAS